MFTVNSNYFSIPNLPNFQAATEKGTFADDKVTHEEKYKVKKEDDEMVNYYDLEDFYKLSEKMTRETDKSKCKCLQLPNIIERFVPNLIIVKQ